MYREMKDSGIQWIGEVPKEWRVSSFKNIVSFIVDNRGKTPPIEDSGIPLLEIDSLKSKYPDISGVRKFLSQQTYDSFLRKYLKGGDILFATVGAIGKISIVPENFNYCIAQNIVGFRINESSDKLFWFYYMKSEAFKMTYLQFNKGNIQDSIKISNLMNGKIVEPLISEQQRIANYLDKKVSKIDDIILKQKSLIEKYKAYKQSLITEIVTNGLNKNVPMKDSGIELIGEIPSHWETTRIKYLIDFNPSYSENLSDDKSVSFVPMECVGNGYMNFKEAKLESVKGKYTYFSNKDIIMAKVTPCFENGNIAIAKDLLNGVGFGSSELYVFRCNKVDTKFMFYYLRNNTFKDGCISTMTGTGGLKRVSASFIENYIIAIPPQIEEQQEIADFLDKKCTAIDSAIAKKEQLIEKLEGYKKSLIYECVTGKREVN